jgi:hypothetical protein
MSVKHLVKERAEKRKLLSEIKEAILEGPNKKRNTFKKLNIRTLDEALSLLINIGNMSFVSGDNDVFEPFIEALYEIVQADIEGLEKERLIKYIHNYGLRSAKDHDIIPYSIVIKNLKEHVLDLRETRSVNAYLGILKNLALKSETSNYELGTLEALRVFREFNGHFNDNAMYVNKFYLKSIMISLMSSAETNRHERLKHKILAEAKEILGFEPPRVQPGSGTDSIPVIEVGAITEEPV